MSDVIPLILLENSAPIISGPGNGVGMELVNLPAELEWSFQEFQQRHRLDTAAARIAYRNNFSHLMRENCLPISSILPDGDAAKFIFCVGRRWGGSDSPDEPLEIESVMLPMKNRHGGQWLTLCISSQIGCRMGCEFCQTGRMGLIHQLSASHIIAQVISVQHWLKENRPDTAIKNIVFMGMGEPLDNADAVFKAIRLFTEPRGMAFAPASITLSTVGRIDGLRRFAREHIPPVRLAISITSADDHLRSRLMPLNRSMPLAKLRQTLLELPRSSRSRYLIQYVMLKGINDDPRDAHLLVQWCRDLPVTVNLIAYNPQDPPIFEASTPDRIEAFTAVLKNAGILVKQRATICQARMGACGQLGNMHMRRRSRNCTGDRA
ncbi:MAG: 23S rRNA (adenine(2503)-C(2))-methyltransferase RlmN [Phycisphaerae bacterium]